jgi:hypothetical protein
VRIVSRSLLDENAWIVRCLQGVGFAPDSYVLQHFSRVERVTGIEPALSAWEPTWYGETTAADRVMLHGVDAASARD